MAKQRISDLPQVTSVSEDDYIVINTNNTVTNIISTYSYSQAIVKLLEEGDFFPNINIDGGDIGVITYDIIDGGTPREDGVPYATILQGGTPVDLGYGPSADGGAIS